MICPAPSPWFFSSVERTTKGSAMEVPTFPIAAKLGPGVVDSFQVWSAGVGVNLISSSFQDGCFHKWGHPQSSSMLKGFSMK